MKPWKWVLSLFAIVSVIAFLVGCSGSQSGNMGSVNVSLSDPPTCQGTTLGSYDHIYVTVADVSIHTSANAGNNDAGWLSLTPSLNNAPKQVDLLGIPNGGCVLATLGSAGIPAGSYQQIRLKLASSNTMTGNPCGGSVANCLILRGANNVDVTYPLQLTSEATTGIKIPSGQIAGGAFTVAAGETKDLNIDFNGCASCLLQMGTDQYLLKPVLHAGEVSATAFTAISGRLINAVGGAAITGKAIVALEQHDANGVDRMVMEVATDPATGQFVLCPVTMPGPFDLVAVAIDSQNNMYGPTVVTGSIVPGTNVGDIKLYAAGTSNSTPAPPALFDGSVSVAGTASNVKVMVSALQPVTLSNASKVTVPAGIAIPAASTVVSSVIANSSTGSYELKVPASGVYVATFSGGAVHDGTAPSLNPTYFVEALTFSTTTTDLPTCTPILPMQFTNVTAGNYTVSSFAFTGCNQ